MKLPNIKRIVVEDFKEEDRDTVERLSYILNEFMQNVQTLTNKRIDFDNLNRELVTFRVITNASGVPISDLTLTTTFVATAHGGKVLSVRNLTNSSALLSSAPFVDFYSTKNNQFRIKQITGLITGNQYEITLEIVGK